MARKLKVAAAHISPVFMDPMGSAEKAAEWIRRGGRDGVDFIVFPEVFIPGFPYWINSYAPLAQLTANRLYQDRSIEADGPELAIVREAARDAGVVVAMGASERAKGGRTCFNSTAFIDRDGTLLGIHRKLKPTYAERYIWGQGDGSTLFVLDSAVGRIGGLACWEHTMNLARQALIEQGIEIHAALWPGLSTIRGLEGINDLQVEAMMRNHALTGQCFVVCASSPVTEEMVRFMTDELGPHDWLSPGGGWTSVIHPFGATLAGPLTGGGDQLLVAEIDLDDRYDVKMWVDSTGHYARPDVLSLRFDRREQKTVIEVGDDA